MDPAAPPRFRRNLIFALAVTLFLTSGGWLDAYVVWQLAFSKGKVGAKSPQGDGNPFYCDIIPGVSFPLPENSSSTILVAKMLLAVAAAAWIEKKLGLYFTGESAWSHHTEEERRASHRLVEFSKIIDQLVGIDEVFRSGITSPVNRLDYAKDIRTAVLESKSVRIASIAGYEFIGSMGKSLLYDLLRSNAGVNLEVVLLDPVARKDIVHERVRALRSASVEYADQDIETEISKTTAAIQSLVDSRGGGDGSICLYKTRLHPAFRMVLTDSVIFVSAYQNNCHGHQAPVLKIRRVFDQHGPTGMSLYAAFSAHFNNLIKDAEPVIKKEF